MAGKFIISVDLGGTNLKLGLLDFKYRFKDKLVVSTGSFSKKAALIKSIVSLIENVIENNALNKAAILGVGIGVPGPVDAARGKVYFFPNIPGWKNVNLRQILEQKLGLKVFLDNDANLMSLAELRLGAAKGSGNALCLTLGTGVGGGVIIDKDIYRGSSFAAGEIGHVPINEKGPRCNCGGIACLESYIGNNAISLRAKQLFRRLVPLEELSLMAKKGNRKAIKIWSEVGNRLGVALSGVINVLNPDVIVVGGGVSNAGNTLFDSLKRTISKRAMPVQAGRVKICRAKLGTDAGLIGAAILVRENSKVAV